MTSTILRTNSIFLPEVSRAAGNFDRGSLVKLLKMLLEALYKGSARGSKCIHRASLRKHQFLDNIKEITPSVALGVAVQDLDAAGRGVDPQHVAGAQELCHVAGKAIDQRHAAKGRTLGEDRVDPVEDQPPAARSPVPSCRAASRRWRPLPWRRRGPRYGRHSSRRRACGSGARRSRGCGRGRSAR
jgi:hypothetical protein